MAVDPLLPHNFSISPVEEVCCSFYLNRDRISFSVPAPYPGWGAIRAGIANKIAALPDTSKVTECSLIYRDRFLLNNDEISRFQSRINQDIFHITRVSDTESALIPTAQSPELNACVSSRFEGGDRQAWTLNFVVTTRESCRFDDQDEILSWFDEAHALIHTLFDQIVPAEIVEIIR